MEREIKFRGKRIDNGMWVYGSFHLHEKVALCMASKEQDDANKQALIIVDGMADWGLSKDVYSIEVDPKTVGQLTGLKNKNGKEIYEGDVLKGIMIGGSITNGVVLFQDGMFVVKQVGAEGYVVPLHTQLDMCLIIGNIYENTELLK